jgi:autotransporter passenger strand-loop-strand repeat protein
LGRRSRAEGSDERSRCSRLAAARRSRTAVSLAKTYLWGGTEAVEAGGVDSSSRFIAGGLESVLLGRVSYDADIGVGGSAYAVDGGVMSGATINSGGPLTIGSDGFAYSDTIGSGGTEYISLLGSAYAGIVESGGALNEGGLTSGTTVLKGGTEYAEIAGANGLTIRPPATRKLTYCSARFRVRRQAPWFAVVVGHCCLMFGGWRQCPGQPGRWTRPLRLLSGLALLQLRTKSLRQLLLRAVQVMKAPEVAIKITFAGKAFP